MCADAVRPLRAVRPLALLADAVRLRVAIVYIIKIKKVFENEKILK
jgi:hypothetical protein